MNFPISNISATKKQQKTTKATLGKKKTILGWNRFFDFFSHFFKIFLNLVELLLAFFFWKRYNIVEDISRKISSEIGQILNFCINKNHEKKNLGVKNRKKSIFQKMLQYTRKCCKSASNDFWRSQEHISGHISSPDVIWRIF